jgi:cytosine/creatinine deaminase
MSVDNHDGFMKDAYEQAHKSYMEGGLPIGAVMVENGRIIGRGHNRRVQHGDPIAHGEMECFRNVGRRANYHNVTLFTTLSPCMMCAGTVVQFGIPRVVIGENKSFSGNIEFLKEHGVDVTLLNDSDCESLMRKFVLENPDLWNEDIAGRENV